MSIIEKAVSALEKQSAQGEPGDQAADADSHDSGDTVQRAVAAESAVAHPVTPETDEAADQHAANAPEALVKAPDDAAADEDAPADADDTTIMIPFDRLQALGMVTPSLPRSRTAEEFRTIKRPLLTNIFGDASARLSNANLVMVTSAIQGDGKTYTSISLAISIAMEMDKTVLFVDADIVRASAGRILGVPDGRSGLLDVLENKGVAVEDVLLRTNIPKLSIIPTGNIHEHSNELLASDSMEKLMRELSQRYPDRVIVFDSPPLLQTTEAGVLASFMGQIVFVVAADRTPQQAVTDALEHIGEDKMVGLVHNRARKRRGNPVSTGRGCSRRLCVASAWPARFTPCQDGGTTAS